MMVFFTRGFCTVLFFFSLMQTIAWGGRVLMEIYSVRINNIDNENPGELYGTITLSYGDQQHIYNRVRGDVESIRPGEYISLTGPAQCIIADQSGNYRIVSIIFFLLDRDLLPHDDEVATGKILVWDSGNILPGDDYDTPIYRQVWGAVDNGSTATNVTGSSATVNYIVFKNAAQATVEVTLIKGDETTNEVYGEIAASNSNFNAFESMLFRKKRSDFVSVTEGKIIPLSRSVVAVPLSSSLTIRALLLDQDFIGSDLIVNGTATFPANTIGTFLETINGTTGGQIRVKVTWSLDIQWINY